MYNISVAIKNRKEDIDMNKQEIFNGLWKITKEKHLACKEEATTIGKDHPTEKGVLQLKAGIYNVATAAGMFSGIENATELMCKRFVNLVKSFPSLAAHYQSLSAEEKDIMAVALYPEVFMRANFYKTYVNELEQAEKDGDPQKIFKARIKKEVLDEILTTWRNFRMQNDLFVFAFEGKES